MEQVWKGRWGHKAQQAPKVLRDHKVPQAQMVLMEPKALRDQ